MTKNQICLPATSGQDARQEDIVQRFRRLLAQFDIHVSGETIAGNGMDGNRPTHITCTLQAPTIYDVSVRLAKGGWLYADETGNRAAPCLTGPMGDKVRIIQEKHRATMTYTPSEKSKGELAYGTL